MAAREENYLLSTEEDCSSVEGDDYSADSELELGDLDSSDENDGSLFNGQGSELATISPQSIQSTNSSSLRSFVTRAVDRVRDTDRAIDRAVHREIVDEGLRLYLNFLQREIRRSRIRAPEFLTCQNRIIPRNISSLRALADRFATSAQRQWIREQAQMVHLQSLNFYSFTDLLAGLFQEGGITWERILVLFFFCADISIRALQEQLTRQFHRIQDWTSHFIQETVCTRVERMGGWGVIFHQSVNHATRLAMLGVCCVGIVALCIYIRNNK